jgi:hypothetical protein
MANLGYAFAMAASAGALATVAALALGAPPLTVIMSAILALGQGLTDLHLTMIRFRRRLSVFSRLQTLRSTLLLTGGVAGALIGGDAAGVLIGLCLAHAVTFAVAARGDEMLRVAPWRSPSMALFQEHLRYGVPAAGASALHLGTVLAARYAITFLAPGAGGTGALLAFDVLQRPFSVVTTAFHAILYPPVVAAYDRGGFGHAKRSLTQLYGVELVCVLGLAIVLALVLQTPSVAALLAPDDLGPGFTAVVPWAAALFATRAALVNLAPLTFHLARRTSTILLVAIGDAATFGLALLISLQMHHEDASAAIVSLTASSLLVCAVSGVVAWLHVRRPEAA